MEPPLILVPLLSNSCLLTPPRWPSTWMLRMCSARSGLQLKYCRQRSQQHGYATVLAPEEAELLWPFIIAGVDRPLDTVLSISIRVLLILRDPEDSYTGRKRNIQIATATDANVMGHFSYCAWNPLSHSTLVTKQLPYLSSLKVASEIAHSLKGKHLDNVGLKGLLAVFLTMCRHLPAAEGGTFPCSYI